VCWLARDITQLVLDAEVGMLSSRENNKVWRLKDLNCVPDFNRFGKYGEVRWRDASGALSDVVPGNALILNLQKRIREQGQRLYLLRMTSHGEKIPGLTDDPIRHQGDGTVPLSSATDAPNRPRDRPFYDILSWSRASTWKIREPVQTLPLRHGDNKMV
jgi:hypothetical protein